MDKNLKCVDFGGMLRGHHYIKFKFKQTVTESIWNVRFGRMF
jgi:hypothetical protein